MRSTPFALVIHFRREISALCVGIASLLIISQLHPLHSHRIAVASRDLQAGGTVTRDDVALVDSNYTWPTASATIEAVIGSTVLTMTHRGSPLTTDVLSHGNVLSHLDTHTVAVAIPISEGERSLVAPPDRVDIYATTQNGGAQVVAHLATVLSHETQAHTSLLNSRSTDAYLYIAVTPSEAFLIAQSRLSSTFSVALLH
ncbi:MAG: SAF domain-containing protein [Actinomycetes bacterium]